MTRTFGRMMQGAFLLLLVSGIFPAYGYWKDHTYPIVGDGDIPRMWDYDVRNWMSTIPGTNVLGDISLVSSHDAGMNEECGGHPTVWAATHFASIGDQLRYGARYFDLRIKWWNGEYRAYHGDCDIGHTLSEIMNDSVEFLTVNPTEIAILKFSHWNADDERKNAMKTILSHPEWTNKFYRSSAKPAPLLNQVPLNELRGKILFLLDWATDNVNDEPENCYDYKETKDLDCTPENGIWRFGDLSFNTKGVYGYYRVYDSYANAQLYSQLIDNQRAKFGNFVRTRNAHTDAFMLCWQLTFAMAPGTLGDIYEGAAEINPMLDDDLGRIIRWGFMERPRLVNLDYIDGNVCRSVININRELREPGRLPVPYLEPQFNGKGAVVNYVTNYCANYRVLNGGIDWTLALDDTDGWYVVSTNGCAFNKGADVAENCHARIILRDGTLLWSFHEDYDYGPSIDVEKTGAALTIYGQNTSTNVMGELEVQGDTYGAGIGAGNDHDGKRITINGGKVTARGGKYASAIGGGNEGSGYDITINGGWVRTCPGENGAGIGGGRNRNGYDITINGGLVEAISGGKSAGIGGGYAGEGHHITINGGYTRAVGSNGGAAIGGGEQHNGGGAGYDITVSGGTVDADEVWHAYNLGHGNDGREPVKNEVAITGGNLWANGRDGQWTCWGLKNPTNSAGQAVYEVTIPDVRSKGPVTVTGLGAYGCNDFYPIDGKLKVYLSNGTYNTIETDEATYAVTVNGAKATATMTHSPKGIMVNDRDIGKGSGPGWTFANNLLSLNEARDYVLSGEYSGENATDSISIDVRANAKVTFDGLILTGWPEHSPIAILSDHVEFVLKGVNTVYTDKYIGTILVSNDCGLVVSGDGEFVGGASAGKQSRCFTVSEGANFVMNGGTIRGYGLGGRGGAILVRGSATINGGLIYDNKACYKSGDLASGYGGGVCVNGSGSLVVKSGTIVSNTAEVAGADIYNSGALRIAGGSIDSMGYAAEHSPTNGSGQLVYKVTIPDVMEGPARVVVTGCIYGSKDLYPNDSNLYLWLTNGTYKVLTSSAAYEATVAGENVKATRTSTDIFVNGCRVELSEGLGWKFEKGVLSLTNAQEYVITGTNTTGKVGIDVRADATVVFDGLWLTGSSGCSPIVFQSAESELVLKGINVVHTDGYVGTILVSNDCGLVVSGDGTLVGASLLDRHSRCFTVQTNAWFVMNGGTIRGYLDNNGGAIRVFGDAEINGGKIWGNVVCTESGTSGGIGGGICVEDGGLLTVNGGTIAGNRILSGDWNDIVGSDNIVIAGGSVKQVVGTVRDGSGNAVSLVIVPGLAGEPTPVKVTGLNDYGTDDLYPDANDQLYFWLLNSKEYVFETRQAGYLVSEGVATRFPFLGVKVNGRDVCYGSGSGWTFADGLLSLDEARDDYILTGTNTMDDVRIDVLADAKVTFDDLYLVSCSNHSPIAFRSADAELILEGVNTIYTDGYVGTILVSNDCGLVVSGDGELVGGAAANKKCRCFTVQTNAWFALNGGTIRGYEAQCGGGLLVYGTATINGGLICDNIANSNYLSSAKLDGYGGGGICVDAGGRLTINGGTIAYNSDNQPQSGNDIYTQVRPAVNGGSIRDLYVAGSLAPTNSAGGAVYAVNVSGVKGSSATVTGLGDYGVQDLYPIGGNLNLWLPNGAYHFWVNDIRYDVTVSESVASSKASEPVNESTIYASQAAAQTAAANSYVARPDNLVAGVVTAEAYDGMFSKKTVERSAGEWGIQPELTTETTNDVIQAISSTEVMSNLISTITNAMPATMVRTTPGLYYGMSSATNVSETGTATPLIWNIGDGTEKEVRGIRPVGATDKAFYQLRVTTQP